MAPSDPPIKPSPAREKFLGLSLESTRKSYYPQLRAQLSALQENEKRLRLLTDNLPARISFVDADQRFQFVNCEYERALDMDRDAIVGRRLCDVLGEDNYHKIESHVLEALNGRHVRFEARFAQKRGGYIWLEANYVPFLEADGRVAGFYDLTHDLTDRKRAEDALRESEAKNRELVQHAPAGIYEIDLETFRFISVNNVMCEYTGYSQSEFLGLDPYALLNEKGQANLKQVLDMVVKEGQDRALLEYAIIGKGGRKIQALVNMRFYFENGRPKRSMGVAHDVTPLREAQEARKRLEVKLQETQKLESLGTLAGGIAHDFNNLLMGIQGNASLSLLEHHPGSSHYQRLKRIEEYVQRGVDLTRQLLGLARGGKYEVQATDLNKLIAASVEMFGRTRKEVQIRFAPGSGLWPVEVDRGQIEQVLLNLLINAWHAMPDGGELTLETGNVFLEEANAAVYSIHPGRYVRVSVADTGIGIDPAVRQKIFDPFFTTKGIGKGSGLGLASAYGIIKNHQGAIDVDSELGRGSEFFFYLPASRKGGVPKETRRSEKLESGRETILLVDDEEMVLTVGEKLLKKLGYTVVPASSGQAAVDVYAEQAERIDLVILDMIMPQMGGSDTFDRLKALNPDVGVLLSSGYSIDGQATRILERGCRGFIQKPFTIGTLSKKLREVLG